MFNSRISSIVLYILLAVSVTFLVLFFVGGVTEETAGDLLQEPKFTDLALQLAYVYFAIATLLAVIFPVIDVISHPKGAGGLLVGVLIFLGVFVVSYLLASNEPIPGVVNPANVPGAIKLVDTGLIANYIFLAIAFVGILFTEVASIFNKN